MPKKSQSIDGKLATLAEIQREIDSGMITSLVEPISAALKDRSNIVTAKGAQLCGRLMSRESIPDLLGSYERFLKNPAKSDKGCLAKSAIIKALYHLDFLEADFYRRHMTYQQPEPVWGGAEDTAVEIRSTCALGLAASNDHRAIMDLVRLLHDNEPAVRQSAVRAVGTLAPGAAEASLRQKAISGDIAAEVIDECFRELLKINPDDSVDFVAEFLESSMPGIREFAAFSLGESRDEKAFEIIKALMEESLIPKIHPHILIQAIGLARIEPAVDFLIELIRTGSPSDAEMAEKALSSYGRSVQDRISEAMRER